MKVVSGVTAVGVKLQGWPKMNTSGCERMTDDHLLKAMEGVICLNGWGLVADLCKRFAKEKGISCPV